MKLAVPDMISNSYFPAIAAVELGFFKRRRSRRCARADLPGRQGLCGAARRRGRFRRRLGAFGARRRFPNGTASKLLCAQAQGMYWFLVMHARSRRRARRYRAWSRAAASARRPGSRWGCAGCWSRPASISIRDGVTIAPVPGAAGAGVNFGVTAAQGAGGRARSTASGRTAWAPRSRCGAASAPSCSTCAAATGRRRASTTRWRRSRRPTR